MNKLTFLIILLGLFSEFGIGQDYDLPLNRRLKVRQAGADQAARKEAAAAEYNSRMNVFGPVSFRRASKSVRLRAEEKQLIALDPKLKTEYSKFVNKSNKGLTKILMEPDCGKRLVLNVVNSKCSTLIPFHWGSSFFSFRSAFYDKEQVSDIHYSDGKIRVGFADKFLGFISDLGEEEIRALKSSQTDIDSLLRYQIPKSRSGVKQAKIYSRRGVQIGAKVYYDKVTPMLGKSYALRSIGYESKPIRREYFLKDVVVVFQIVRIDPNGSITIAWKRLKMKRSPYLRK